MKKLLSLVLVIMLLTGCKLVDIDSQSYDEIVDEILNTNISLANQSFNGYSYYLPKGVRLHKNLESNSILKYNRDRMFLYVDIVSFYHGVKGDFEVNPKAHFSKKINIGKKEGYVEITKINDRYFIEYMYNYAKMEMFVQEREIKRTLTVMSYILNSVRYNRLVISSKIGESGFSFNEESFNIFKPKREEGNYIDYHGEDYDKNFEDVRDEDKVIDLDNISER